VTSLNLEGAMVGKAFMLP